MIIIKKLYLLRHAQSYHPQGVDDKDRSLDETGKLECVAMNKYILANNIKPETVLCSDAKRTEQTAKAVFKGINVNISYNKKLYLATPGEILKEIAKVKDEINSLMVVAHNPGIQQFVLLLTGSGNLDALKNIKTDYPTCAFTEFSVNVERWKDLEPSGGTLERFVF